MERAQYCPATDSKHSYDTAIAELRTRYLDERLFHHDEQRFETAREWMRRTGRV